MNKRTAEKRKMKMHCHCSEWEKENITCFNKFGLNVYIFSIEAWFWMLSYCLKMLHLNVFSQENGIQWSGSVRRSAAKRAKKKWCQNWTRYSWDVYVFSINKAFASVSVVLIFVRTRLHAQPCASASVAGKWKKMELLRNVDTVPEGT